MTVAGKSSLRDKIRQILTGYRTVAVVGLSDKPVRDSYQVAAYLQQNGYRIVPVNPASERILGETAYPDLMAVPFPIDIVDVFRRREAVPGIVEQAIAVGAKVVWLQIGIVDNDAARVAEAAGLQVVQNRCMKIEHAQRQVHDAGAD